MEQRGRVVSVDDDMAEVSIVRSSACGDSCASCGGECSSAEVTVRARMNGREVRTGDVVEIKGSTKKMLISTFVAYLIPLILLMVGTIVGTSRLEQMKVENYEIFGFLIGLVGLAVSFFVIRVVGNKMNREAIDFEISRVLKKRDNHF